MEDNAVYRKRTGLSKTLRETDGIYFGNKIYFNKGFVDKIEINIANVSSSPTDEFQLISYYYDFNEFQCEACEHEHCLNAFIVQNLKTKKNLKVGSECIHKFANKGVNLELADALMKRVSKATRQARQEVVEKLGIEAFNALSEEERGKYRWNAKREKITELGKKAFKALPKSEKSKITIKQFMAAQAYELLLDVAANKHLLSEEEINNIIKLGLFNKMEEAEKQRQAKIRQQKILEINQNVEAYFNSKLRSFSDIEESIITSFKKEYKDIDAVHEGDVQIKFFTERYENRKRTFQQYQWILQYKGTDGTVLDIRSYLERNGYLTTGQIHLARGIITNNGKPDVEFENVIKFLLEKEPTNYFFNSINKYYEEHKYVTEGQRESIMVNYRRYQIEE